jgi:hypothetical protein
MSSSICEVGASQPAATLITGLLGFGAIPPGPFQTSALAFVSPNVKNEHVTPNIIDSFFISLRIFISNQLKTVNST